MHQRPKVLDMARNPTCPNCGFAVFNRRYPKCERCGVQLPAGLVYSREERMALEERERQEELARRVKRDQGRDDNANIAPDSSFSSDSFDAGNSSAQSDGACTVDSSPTSCGD